MKYLGSSFQTGGYTRSYADNFDRIFRGKCGAVEEHTDDPHTCERPKDHENEHCARYKHGDGTVKWWRDLEGYHNFIDEKMVIG